MRVTIDGTMQQYDSGNTEGLTTFSNLTADVNGRIAVHFSRQDGYGGYFSALQLDISAPPQGSVIIIQ